MGTRDDAFTRRDTLCARKANNRHIDPLSSASYE